MRKIQKPGTRVAAGGRRAGQALPRVREAGVGKLEVDTVNRAK